jgi:hypothetical protein
MAVCVLQCALVIFMRVEMFPAMVVARFLQGAASSVVFSGECPCNSSVGGNRSLTYSRICIDVSAMPETCVDSS